MTTIAGISIPSTDPTFLSIIREVLGLEPSSPLRALARRAAPHSSMPLTFIEGSAEAIPLERASVICR